MKKLLVMMVLLMSAFSFAQDAETPDGTPLYNIGGVYISKPFGTLGNRWQFTDPASFYGFVGADIGLGPKIFGQYAFLTPSIGVSQETRDKYFRVRLSLDGDYVTSIADCRYADSQAYCSLEISFTF